MRLSLLFAAAALLAPLPAAAQDWYRVSVRASGALYIDRDSIRKEGDRTVAIQVLIYPEVKEDKVKAVKATAEIDCKARNVRYALFTPSGTDGKDLFSLEWPDQGAIHPVTPNSFFADLTDFACDVDRSGAVRVADPFADNP